MTILDDGVEDASSSRDGLTAQLRELEAFVTRSDAAGEQIPAEAVEIIARLREIIVALEGLTATLDPGNTDPSEPSATS